MNIEHGYPGDQDHTVLLKDVVFSAYTVRYGQCEDKRYINIHRDHGKSCSHDDKCCQSLCPGSGHILSHPVVLIQIHKPGI